MDFMELFSSPLILLLFLPQGKNVRSVNSGNVKNHRQRREGVMQFLVKSCRGHEFSCCWGASWMVLIGLKQNNESAESRKKGGSRCIMHITVSVEANMWHTHTHCHRASSGRPHTGDVLEITGTVAMGPWRWRAPPSRRWQPTPPTYFRISLSS